MDGWDDDEDFWEEDGPVADVLAAFERGIKLVTARPEPCCYSDIECVTRQLSQTRPPQPAPETRHLCTPPGTGACTG